MFMCGCVVCVRVREREREGRDRETDRRIDTERQIARQTERERKRERERERGGWEITCLEQSLYLALCSGIVLALIIAFQRAMKEKHLRSAQ